MTIKKEREPVGKTEADILDELRSLSITAAHELLSGFDRLKQLRDDWEADESGNGDDARKQRERAKGLAYELARHEIKHAERILSLSHSQADMLFEHARRLVRRMRSSPKGQPRHPAKVVDLEAYKSAPDEPADATFGITNPFDVAADARFFAPRFATQSGDEVGGLSKPTFDIGGVIPPNAARTVTIQVRIEDAGDCDVGVYFTELEVYLVGHVEQLVARRLLRLRVLASRAAT